MITKERIKQIIKEAIDKVLSQPVVDIRKIDINILRRAYKDYRIYNASKAYGHPLYSPATIQEAVFDIVPPDEVIEEITKKYDLPQELSFKQEHYNKIYVYFITACCGVNEKLIEQDMNKLGYFLSRREDTVKVEDMAFTTLQFEPTSQMQTDETENILNKFSILYHWTPESNVTKIMHDGLLPQHKNVYFNFPPRTYLISPEASEKDVMQLGQELCTNNHNASDGNYVLLKIETRPLKGTDVKFYLDPNSNIGIYSEQPIPPEVIGIQLMTTFHKGFLQQ